MFHWNHGWFFRRLPNGSVHIQKRKTAHDNAEVEVEATIPAAEWASVVAAVSQWGESGPTWQIALAFHGEIHHDPV